MDVNDNLHVLCGTIESNASAETVYGTPIDRGDRTVVPIARVEYGLGGGDAGGGGGGGGANDAGGGGGGTDDNDGCEGSGLGGGFSAQPAGALEVTDGGTRYVKRSDRRSTRGPIAAVLVGLALGLVVRFLLGDIEIDWSEYRGIGQ